MHFGIIGYGKMGKAIHQLSGSHTISILKARSLEEKKEGLIRINPDVVIEFTHADAVIPHIKLCIDLGIPIVTGTTGWHSLQSEVNAYCMDHNGALFFSSNFSIGANLFFMMNARLGEIMNRYPDYDVNIHEVHHIEKKDKPSGTAITLGQQIIADLDRKNDWSTQAQGDENMLQISSDRVADVNGIHEIRYNSSVDTISIKHEAHNRNGFALGAIQAATWLAGKTGIFGMADLLDL